MRTAMGLRLTVICFFKEVSVPVERPLIDAGRFDTVRETRDAVQDAMRDNVSAAVQEAVGRESHPASLFQVHVAPGSITRDIHP